MNLLAGQSASGELAGWKSWHEKPNVKTEDVWRLDSAGVLHCKGTPLGRHLQPEGLRGFCADARLALGARWESGQRRRPLAYDRRLQFWPKSLEAQINAGDAGDFWGLDGYTLSGPTDRMKALSHPQFGSLINVKKLEAAGEALGPVEPLRDPAQGEIVTLRINGREANAATGCSPRSGRICLTSEGDPYEFRNVRLTVLGSK